MKVKKDYFTFKKIFIDLIYKYLETSLKIKF